MEAKMKRCLLLVCVSLLFLSAAAVAQETGSLMFTVQTAPDSATPASPLAGAKVVVVHWTNPGLHPMLVQDQVATTNQMGICTVDLPPGKYDVFVSSSELAPAAFRREISAGRTTSLTASLRPSPTHLRPIE
jgi:hypothetical protein